jgi:hypothetical protein
MKVLASLPRWTKVALGIGTIVVLIWLSPHWIKVLLGLGALVLTSAMIQVLLAPKKRRQTTGDGGDTPVDDGDDGGDCGGDGGDCGGD